jgi:hypothetical protein
MKTGRSFPLPQYLCLLVASAILAWVPSARAADSQQPSITAIRLESTNVVVTARVPSGVRRVTLECRQRLGAGTWEPRAVARLDGSAGTLTFRLARSRQLEIIRVRADFNEPLPSAFYAGTNNFLGQPGTSGGPEGVVFMTDTRGGFLDVGVAPGGSQPREVVESDIYKIRGNTLYFFNQLRGLQFIDVGDPDHAVVRGTLALPAAGEDMYLLGERHVVLLARDGCSYDQSEVVVVSEINGQPTIVASLPVPGYIQESRLVGSALYVASQTYRPQDGTTGSAWEWGTLVSSFDLADPAAPVSRGTLWYSGYGNVVAATDLYLFVVTQDPNNWWQSVVRIIDISAPDGTMNAYGSVHTAGRVQDKFKMNYVESVFTTISEDWHWDNGQRVVTKLETFRLPDPRSAGPIGIVKLGELELGRGERLHASRFDGNRVYVVTFLQIDPLWVVDLSDPARPRIAGSVDVTGWSTYIEPIDDRLVTVGVDGSRVAVSLFDVRDPSAPRLLSRVRLGDRYSSSEANWDEKAFTVLREEGLILVPYNGDTTNGYISRVQLIDLNPTTLVARGVIEHQFQPRRATGFANRILSLSGSELLSVDATDRDQPVARGKTDLAWPVDRVFVRGNFLIEVTTSTGWGWSWWWGQQDQPAVRVTPASDPNQVLGALNLSRLAVLGATVRGDRLYVAQGPSVQFYPYLALDATGDAAGTDTNGTPFLLTVIGLDRLPELHVLGQSEIKTGLSWWSGDFQAVWPKEDVLVWVGGAQSYWWWRWGPVAFDVAGGGVRGLAAEALFWPWYWGGDGGQLLAFDVSDPAAPQFASEVDLSSSNRWSFSRAFTSQGLVYVSHQASEFVPGLISPWQSPTQTNLVFDANGRVIGTNVVLAGTWVQRYYLDVVDYADAKDPTVRAPVNIPGALQGISHQGSLLYTLGPHWNTNWWGTWTEYLDASAYDGVSAYLVDSLALSNNWPRPVLVVETNVFIGRSGYISGSTDGDPHYLETWTLPATGRFTQLGRVTLKSPANTLADFNGLLAAQANDNTIALFDRANPAALRLVGEGEPPGCLWIDLSHADGQPGRGLWVPLGVYGVFTVPTAP